MSLFKELKRRNVFRVAAAYVVVGWLVIQISNTLINIMQLPPAVTQTILLFFVLGFIPVIFFSWAFEITPEGIKKERDVVRDDSITNITAKKLDYVTVVAALGVAGLFIWQQMNPPEFSQVDNNNLRSSTIEKINTASIAVLPFVALNNDEDDSYFGKGLAEELLNALAQFPDLKVAARTSAFSFDGKDVDLREMGETLGVAHVLEGSIRRSGERLRITAQLIRASDGFHLWSETYERELTDIFQIQDEIVSELSRVLQFQLGVGAGAGRAAKYNIDPHAYEQYMRGLDLWWKRDNDKNRAQAIIAFRNATELDKNFADAWASYAKSLAYSGAVNIPGVAIEDYKSVLKEALNRALLLDPLNIKAHTASVFYYTSKDIDIERAQHHLEKVLQLAPSSAQTQYSASNFYAQTGDLKKALQANTRAVALDPLNKTVNRTRFQLLAIMGRFDEGIPIVEKYVSCEPPACDFNHFIAGYTVTSAANIASTNEVLRQRRDQWLKNLHEVEPLPPFAVAFNDFTFNYYQSILGETQNVDDAYWQSVDISSWLFKQNAALAASIFSQMGQNDTALEILKAAYTSGNLFNSLQSDYVLTKGRWEFPEHLRRDSRYHEFWDQPGLNELAKIRIANGQTAGLPLPVDGKNK